MNLYLVELMDWFDYLIATLIFISLISIFCVNRHKKIWKWIMAALSAAVIAFGISLSVKQVYLDNEIDEIIEEQTQNILPVDTLLLN